MMTPFDSHRYATRLSEAGMSPALASIQAEMAGDMMKELMTFDARLERTDNKIDLYKSQLETRIADTKAELIRWVVGVGVLQSSLLAALLLRLTQ